MMPLSSVGAALTPLEITISEGRSSSGSVSGIVASVVGGTDSSVGAVVSEEISVGDVSSGGAVVSVVVASVASVSMMLSVAPISAADTLGIIPKHRTNTNRNEMIPRMRLDIEKSFPLDLERHLPC